ncbi:MAG TPA: ATP-binding cassette domain-containing protein [Polyangiaceae bacterium]|nr:ATP-binding cassette domain-containing protein [Polyangiaceae bacterium]
MSSETLSVRLRKSLPALTVEVTFEVPPGVTILFGPSGAGKSTTLSAIAGIVRPDAGRVALGDVTLYDSERAIDVPAESRRLSLVFQSLALFPHLTARQNVEYGIDRKVAASERTERASRMLERMKVAHVADRRPSTFSGGEAQRVALARAFAREPRVVLLDEAFSAMDRELRYELGREVRAMVDELRIPTLLVTHHRMEARLVGDRAVLIRDGRIEAEGPVRDVVPAPEREQQR